MNIILFHTPGKKGSEIVINEIKNYAEKFDIEVREYSEKEKKLDVYDIAIAAGGDGTFLWTSSVVNQFNIPILGINLGSLGFLTDIKREEIEDAFQKIVNREYELEERAMLRINYDDRECIALNDAVFSMEKGRMIELEIKINEKFVTDVSGDGLIICTPTGSTAYSLSSGGPIMAPGTEGIIITPICPHTLTFRPLVVDSSSQIKIISQDVCLLMCDGQRCSELEPGKEVLIRKSEKTLKIIKIKGKDYFQILREKLDWGNR